MSGGGTEMVLSALRLAAGMLVVAAVAATVALAAQPGGAPEASPAAGAPAPSKYQQRCVARVQGFMARTLRGIERTIELTADQKAIFEELKAAVLKARQTLQSACPAQQPRTAGAWLKATNARIKARLAAVDMVRPILDKFYASLTDAQKAQYAALNHKRYGPSSPE